MKDYEPHPIAEVFPIIPDSEMKELVAAIKAHGLIHPITIYEGKILDGRHRYKACQIAGVKPRFVELAVGDDPVEFAVGMNLSRRHLTTSQRAMSAAKLETMRHGGDRKSQDARLQLNRTETAETWRISPRSVATASKILDESPKIAEQVHVGKISVHAAEKKIAEKKAVNEPVLDDIGTRIPYHALPFWKRRQDVQDMLTTLSRIKSTVEKAKKEGDCMFGKVSNSVIDTLSNVYTHLLEAKPYAVCTSCQGHFEAQPKGCAFCGNKGLISKWQWDVQAPKELKDLRLKANAKDAHVH